MKENYFNLAGAIIDAIAENQKEYFECTFQVLLDADKRDLFQNGISIDTEREMTSLCATPPMIYEYPFSTVRPVFKKE